MLCGNYNEAWRCSLIVCHLSCGVIVSSSALPFLKLFQVDLLRCITHMLRAALRMLPIPRGGHGAGRAARRNHSRPYHASTTRNSLAVAVAVKPIPAADDDRQRHFSEQTFADAPISNASKSGIKHQYLSDVQAATLESGLAGKDLLVQAKTGTGKTMAFLLPTVERLAKRQELPRKGQISALILSPTRELAMQVTYYYRRS